MHWKTLQRKAQKGTVPAFRIDGRWRFRASLLEAWLEKRLVNPHYSEVKWNQPTALRDAGEQE